MYKQQQQPQQQQQQQQQHTMTYKSLCDYLHNAILGVLFTEQLHVGAIRLCVTWSRLVIVTSGPETSSAKPSEQWT